MLTSLRAAQQIRFAKMPVRTRSGSSPIRSSNSREGPELFITSPSRRSGEGRLRRGSLGAVETIKHRARRDTTTSSDMSSENELDPSIFKRRQINPTRTTKSSNLLAEKLDRDEARPIRNETINEGSGEESEGSSLSSEFAETADSESLLGDVPDALASTSMIGIPAAITLNPPSPRKPKNAAPNVLQALPPPRPISTIQPISALGEAIRAQQSKPKNPVEIFARLSGKGALNPLNIRIYAPFSSAPSKPFEMPLQRTAQESSSGDNSQVTVAEAIGLSLWRYYEEGLKPPIARNKLDVNQWTLRMVDDGEVEPDFPALSRISPIIDFTSNNNRATRGRSRGKPYDEFALVEATETQFLENRKMTPKYSEVIIPLEEDSPGNNMHLSRQPEAEPTGQTLPRFNVILDQPFTSAAKHSFAAPADKPAFPISHSTPRTGPPKMLKIYFTSLEAYTQTNTIEVTTDTYIAEVLDTVCRRWNLDKAHHFLKVSGTNTVAPLDRTVESIGARTDLDLLRRRFAHDGGLGLTGSPGSSSPSAPLVLTTETPRKGKKVLPMAHPLAQAQDLWGNGGNYKKYTVVRKQPMSFTPSHQRTLLMDSDYMHILPAESGKTVAETSAKTTTVPFSMIVGCKVSRRHPKTFRVRHSIYILFWTGEIN